MFVRDVFGVCQWHGMQLFAPYQPVRVVPDNSPQPARKCRRLGKGRKRRPCGNEGLLDDIFRLLKVVELGERRAEGEMLKAARQIDKGLNVASSRLANQLLMIH